MYAIYSLVDPRDNTPRYVGITDDVYKRLLQHLRCDGSNFRRDAWIRELKAANVMVSMPTLQTVYTIEEARTREAYWIYHYLQLGIMLFNNTIPTPFTLASPQNQAQFRRMKRDTEANMIIAFHEEDRVEQVSTLRSQGWGKIASIEKVWNVKRGGSQAYKDAQAEYEQIISKLEEG